MSMAVLSRRQPARFCRLPPWPRGTDMPQSIRDQIEEAIRNAQDAGLRSILLIQLSLADMMAEVRDSADTAARAVENLHLAFTAHDAEQRKWMGEAFRNIPPEVHITDHGFVGEQRQRRAADKSLIDEAKKGAAAKIGEVLVELAKVAFLLAAGALMSKLLG